jgi:hypothetical protein
VNDFIEECRKEWRRLRVPDPIANEMAADLAADIAEAEAEGGSAEDVLGNSLFDPQRFAASWAGARGVTSPPPSTPARSPSSRTVVTATLATLGVFLFLGALLVGIGRRSASVAYSMGRILGPGRIHIFGPGQAAPPLRRMIVPDPLLVVGQARGVAIFAVVLLFMGVVALGFAVICWAPWTRRHSRGRQP